MKKIKFENVRLLREGEKKTQSEIADVLEIAQNTYSQYEAGKVSMNADTLIKLADYYKMSVDYLLGRTERKDKE